MASPRVVDKFDLKTIPHAKPYKLSWLKEEEIKVTKQVLLNFLIGNFKDEALCDIVPMKANHILLGRPWQFDRKVVYDGHANTYVFSSLGKKFTILPLPPSQENEDQNKIKYEKEKEKEKGQAFTKELLAYKKNFSKQEVQHRSPFSSQTKRDEQKHKKERESGIKIKEGISKTKDEIIKEEESSHQLTLQENCSLPADHYRQIIVCRKFVITNRFIDWYHNWIYRRIYPTLVRR